MILLMLELQYMLKTVPIPMENGQPVSRDILIFIYG